MRLRRVACAAAEGAPAEGRARGSVPLPRQREPLPGAHKHRLRRGNAASRPQSRRMARGNAPTPESHLMSVPPFVAEVEQGH